MRDEMEGGVAAVIVNIHLTGGPHDGDTAQVDSKVINWLVDQEEIIWLRIKPIAGETRMAVYCSNGPIEFGVTDIYLLLS